MQQALVEAMRFDIEEGNLCDALLEKIYWHYMILELMYCSVFRYT